MVGLLRRDVDPEPGIRMDQPPPGRPRPTALSRAYPPDRRHPHVLLCGTLHRVQYRCGWNCFAARGRLAATTRQYFCCVETKKAEHPMTRCLIFGPVGDLLARVHHWNVRCQL